jgi:hypothetical protein
MMITKEFISKTTLSVIPACLESFLKKDAGFIRLRRTGASMTEHLYACDFTYGDMLRVYGEIKRYNSQETGNPFWHLNHVKNSPIPFFCDKSGSYGSGRKNEAQQKTVEGGYCEIVKPAYTFGYFQDPARCKYLPYGHEYKDACEKRKPYQDFIIDNEHVHKYLHPAVSAAVPYSVILALVLALSRICPESLFRCRTSRKDSRQTGMTLKTNIQFLTPWVSADRYSFLGSPTFYGRITDSNSDLAIICIFCEDLCRTDSDTKFRATPIFFIFFFVYIIDTSFVPMVAIIRLGGCVTMVVAGFSLRIFCAN